MYHLIFTHLMGPVISRTTFDHDPQRRYPRIRYARLVVVVVVVVIVLLLLVVVVVVVVAAAAAAVTVLLAVAVCFI